MSIQLYMTTKAFSTEAARKYLLEVDTESGDVRVFDTIAGYFTSCHSLAPGSRRAAIARARKLAGI